MFKTTIVFPQRSTISAEFEPVRLQSLADMAEDDVERQLEKPPPVERSIHAVFYIAYVYAMDCSIYCVGIVLTVVVAQKLDLLFQLDHPLQQVDN